MPGCLVAKAKVAGSNPVFRSKLSDKPGKIRAFSFTAQEKVLSCRSGQGSLVARSEPRGRAMKYLTSSGAIPREENREEPHSQDVRFGRWFRRRPERRAGLDLQESRQGRDGLDHGERMAGRRNNHWD